MVLPFPGREIMKVQINEPSFAADTVAYAINEGGVIADVWESDEEEGVIALAFCVSEATADELSLLRREHGKLPANAVLRTTDGRLLIANAEGIVIHGGPVKAMGDLPEASLLLADVRYVVAAFFLAAETTPERAEKRLLSQLGEGEIYQAFGRLIAS